MEEILCPDCDIPMEPMPTSYGLQRVTPPNVPRGSFYPVAGWFCPDCGLLRLYSAHLLEPELWEAGTPDPDSIPGDD